MPVLKKIRQDFSPPDTKKSDTPAPAAEKAAGSTTTTPIPCRGTPDCLIWWYDHGDQATGTPPRLRCGTCDPPPEKSRQYVAGALRLPGADGYEPPLPDREFFALPCGLAEWGCSCGREDCALGRAERAAAESKREWAEKAAGKK